EVMEAFLAGRPASISIPPELFTLPDFAPELDPLLAADHAPQSWPYALVGQVERLVPGREVILRRVMDLREDLYADDHTLGGRGVSRVDPGQNGLPVLPMTFSLEAMAEAAALLAPGKVVAAIRDI